MAFIIYRGRGKRVVGFALLGALLSFPLMLGLYKINRDWAGFLLFPSVLWGAALGMWFAVRHLGKPGITTRIDSVTGRQVQVEAKDDLFFLPPLVWAILGTVLAAGVSGLAVIAFITGGFHRNLAKHHNGSSENSPVFGAPDLWKMDEQTAFKEALQALERLKPGAGTGDAFVSTITNDRCKAVRAMLAASTNTDAEAARSAFAMQTSYGCLRSNSIVVLVRMPGFDDLTPAQRDLITRAYLYALYDQVRSLLPVPSRFGLAVVTAGGVTQLHTGRSNPEIDKYPVMAPVLRGEAAATAVMSFFAPGPKPIVTVRRLANLDDERARQLMRLSAQFSLLPKGVQSPLVISPATPPAKETPAPPSVSAMPGTKATALPTPMRDWTSTDGRVMKASLVRFIDASHAEFKREDGPLFAVSLDKLSAENQAELRQMAASASAVTLELATRQEPFTNSLGMKFVPVPGTKVLFCIHETRKRDYIAFSDSDPAIDKRWLTKTNAEGLANPGDDYPAAFVNWDEATAFCAWLSSKEHQLYRLPTDYEWSCAAGLENEDLAASPESKSGKSPAIYPWGSGYPPKTVVANLADESTAPMHPEWTRVKSYTDGHVFTVPVMSFPANSLGLHDLSGNLAEWCSDSMSPISSEKVVRGGGYATGGDRFVGSDYRGHRHPNERWTAIGFRVVLRPGSASPK